MISDSACVEDKKYFPPVSAKYPSKVRTAEKRSLIFIPILRGEEDFPCSYFVFQAGAKPTPETMVGDIQLSPEGVTRQIQ